MPSYKLTYFDVKGGRGESIRMAFHCAGIPYIDERLTPEQFGKIKDTLPFGQLPILTIDEKTVIFQEVAILRYIGRLAGLYPDDPEEALYVDIGLCLVDDLYKQALAFFLPEDQGRSTFVKMVIDETLPKVFSDLDKHLGKRGTNFSAGNNLTISDLRIYASIIFFRAGTLQGLPVNLIDNYPNIVKLQKFIEGHEKIASWIKTRAQ